MYYTKTIKKGQSGDDVMLWQEYLQSQGYDFGGTIDGIFGDLTDKYTRQWQEQNGIGADGIVGEKTWGAAGFKMSPTQQGFEYNDYSESDAVKDYKEQLEAHGLEKPGSYDSKWQSNIDQLISQIANREKFSYDLNADSLYNQYAEQYRNMGKMASADVMGQAAAMTGGYGNSYAATVGNQAYQSYLGKLNEIAPELYQDAYSRYKDEENALYDQLGMYQDMETIDYAKYNDEVTKYLAEKDYLANMLNAERELDYEKHLTEEEKRYNKYLNDVEKEKIWNSERAEQLKKRQEEQQEEQQYSDPYKALTLDINNAIQLERSFTSMLDYISEAASDSQKANAVQHMLDNLPTAPASDTNPYGYKVISSGGANWGGIDEDAVIKLPGEAGEITLLEFKNKLVNAGLSSGAAERFVIKLQNDLGISKRGKRKLK